MFVRNCLSLSAILVSAGVASAQSSDLAGTFPGTTVPQPEVAAPHAEEPVRVKPVDNAPKRVPPLPVSVNPAAPTGYNAPTTVCPTEPDGIGPGGRFWASGEWLYWATSGQTLPAIGTSSPIGTDRSLAGVMGSPNSPVIYGGDRANKDFRNGYRLNAGGWFNDERTRGIEGDFFFLGNSVNNFAVASNGAMIITRPFFNALKGLPDDHLISFPGVVGGALTSHSENSIIGGGFNGIWNLCGKPCGRVDALVGFRYLNVSDEVHLRENLTALPGSPVIPGANIQISDRFGTSNNFYGGLIGISAEKQSGLWFCSVRSTIAFGLNNQIVDVRGSTLIAAPGGPAAAYAGGLYGQPSNIGRYSNNAFAVAPEIGVRAGVQVTSQARLFVGYNFLYLSNVVRAGDQIDTRVNANQLPPQTVVAGPALPTFLAKTTDFWAQGISLGLEVRY